MFRGLAGLLAATAWFAGPLSAQEPDSIPAQEETREGIAPAIGECTLRWRPLEENTRSFTNRDVVGDHVTYLSGRYLWTCGSATMEADSAVKRDGPQQVELLGRVVYEDTIRTLKSDRLLYFQPSDFVIAEENVELERLIDGSTLSGPRVEFLRAVSGVDAFTTAPGRPTVTFYPQEGESREPFVIEADLAIFAGEDEARFQGDAVIARSDFDARADTAFLTREDGVGLMWGEPWIEAEGIRLEGDTIRFTSENEALETVQAVRGGYAAGENFEVRSEAIDIELDDQEVRHVWAHGEGRGEATSGSHELHGDSLHFVMYRSRIDTAYAYGEAIAIQRDTTFVAADAEAAAGDEAAEDSTAVRPDTLAGPTEPESGAVPRDSAAAVEEEAAVEQAEAGAGADPAAGETDEEAPEEAEDPESGTDEGPELALDGSMNWARGDTLIAMFERPDEAVADSVAGAEPAMSSLVLAGDASALYRMVRDSTATARPSRNYLVGTRIQVNFEDGEPLGVVGEHAIGVYLEPREVFGETAQDEAPADSTSAGEVEGTLPDDSTRVAPDTVSTPPDTAAAPPDTSSAPPDTSSAPPDTLRAGGDPSATPFAVLPHHVPPGRPAPFAPDTAAHRARRAW
ncbi:hypothetical protein [Candidatus Palauibacter sp.]|uniref:hypothetical protein n=1 Tax=Candidatus Palauibacter sp. TaxID=3101350 RepID=UPI003B01C0BF